MKTERADDVMSATTHAAALPDALYTQHFFGGAGFDVQESK